MALEHANDHDEKRWQRWARSIAEQLAERFSFVWGPQFQKGTSYEARMKDWMTAAENCFAWIISEFAPTGAPSPWAMTDGKIASYIRSWKKLHEHRWFQFTLLDKAARGLLSIRKLRRAIARGRHWRAMFYLRSVCVSAEWIGNWVAAMEVSACHGRNARLRPTTRRSASVPFLNLLLRTPISERGRSEAATDRKAGERRKAAIEDRNAQLQAEAERIWREQPEENKTWLIRELRKQRDETTGEPLTRLKPRTIAQILVGLERPARRL